jgi:cell division protein FtsB
MRILKYLIPLWCGVLVYSAASLCVGATGLRSFDELLEEKNKQTGNLDELRRLNMELEGTRDALKYDDDTISVYARELGFGTEDERFIRIVGDRIVRTRQMDTGESLAVTEPTAVKDTTLRIIAIVVAAALFLFISFTDLIRNVFRNSSSKYSTV